MSLIRQSVSLLMMTFAVSGYCTSGLKSSNTRIVNVSPLVTNWILDVILEKQDAPNAFFDLLIQTVIDLYSLKYLSVYTGESTVRPGTQYRS